MFDCNKYKKIAEKIENLALKTEILVISKNQPFSSVLDAINCGVTIFGENRVQEAILKFEQILLKKKALKLHLTGPLQTNKVKQALNIFNVFHTLDREKLLKEFSKFPELIKDKSFYIQVNTGKEKTKSGVEPESVKSFLQLCNFYGLKNIEGLMCIPPVRENPSKHFELLDSIRKELNLKKLSIGMSSDYLDALCYEPSFIRLGTILFGKRE